MKETALTITLAVLVLACKPSGHVQCDSDESCNLETGGVCLVNPGTSNQWCSYPDAVCMSGFRWSDLDVGDGVGGRCVDLAALDHTPPEVVSRTPEPGDDSASPSVVVSVTFSEKIDPASATSSSVSLQEDGGGATPIRVATNGEVVVVSSNSPLDPQRTYRVMVTQDVRDLAGNQLKEAVSWTFKTREASWAPQVLLEAEQGKAASNIDAAASNGVVVATWAFSPCVTYQQCDFSNEIWAVVRKNGSWAPASRISPSAFQTFLPRVAVDAMGRAAVIWTQRDSSGAYYLMGAPYDGTSWGAAVIIESFGTLSSPGNPVVRSDGEGNMFAAWVRNGGTYPLYVARFSPSTGWSAPQRIDALESSVVGGFALVTSGTNSAAVLWYQAGALRMARYAAGTWAAPSGGPQVPFTGNMSAAAFGGELSVSWYSNGLSASRVSGASGATWESPVRIDDPSFPTPPSVGDGRDLQYLANGTLLTAWTQGNDARQAMRPSGQAWGLSVPLEPFNSFASGLTLASGGTRAFALFVSGVNSELFSNEYNPSTGWQGAERVPLAYNGGGPYTVVYDSGSNNFVAIFGQSPANEVKSVFAKVYQ